MLARLRQPIYYARKIEQSLCDEHTTDLRLTPFHVALDFLFDDRYVVVLVSRSESIVLVRRDLWRAVRMGGLDQLADSDRHEFARIGLLIPADLDEVELHRMQIDHRHLLNTTLELEIGVTKACNYRCNYCYELGTEFPSEFITPPTIAKIAAWMELLLTDEQRYIEQIAITLIGGEPLLRPKLTYRLLDTLNAVAQRHGLPSETVIVTNGHRLAREMMSELRARGVTRIQVTLDGPPEVHDARRHMTGGQATFATIVTNLNSVYDLVDINLRMNMDKHNVPFIPAFLDTVRGQPFMQGVTSLIFAPVHHTIDNNSFIQQYGLQEWELPPIYYAIHRELIARQLGHVGLANIPGGAFSCPFFSSNAFHVTTDGELTRCSLVSGRGEFATSHLDRQLIIPLTPMNSPAPSQPVRQPDGYAWTDFKFAHQCLDEVCPYYAMCTAGCPYDALVEHGTTEIRACPKPLFETIVHDWVHMFVFNRYASEDERARALETLLDKRPMPLYHEPAPAFVS